MITQGALERVTLTTYALDDAATPHVDVIKYNWKAPRESMLCRPIKNKR